MPREVCLGGGIRRSLCSLGRARPACRILSPARPLRPFSFHLVLRPISTRGQPWPNNTTFCLSSSSSVRPATQLRALTFQVTLRLENRVSFIDLLITNVRPFALACCPSSDVESVKSNEAHTIGVEFGSKVVDVANKRVKLQVRRGRLS